MGTSNPADTMTKIFRDPIAVINSPLYRQGPARFSSREALDEDVVATCQDGVFTYIGPPTKFLPIVQSEGCLSRLETERCALVQTITMKIRGRMLGNFTRCPTLRFHTGITYWTTIMSLGSLRLCLSRSTINGAPGSLG